MGSLLRKLSLRKQQPSSHGKYDHDLHVNKNLSHPTSSNYPKHSSPDNASSTSSKTVLQLLDHHRSDIPTPSYTTKSTSKKLSHPPLTRCPSSSSLTSKPKSSSSKNPSKTLLKSNSSSKDSTPISTASSVFPKNNDDFFDPFITSTHASCDDTASFKSMSSTSATDDHASPSQQQNQTPISLPTTHSQNLHSNHPSPSFVHRNLSCPSPSSSPSNHSLALPDEPVTPPRYATPTSQVSSERTQTSSPGLSYTTRNTSLASLQDYKTTNHHHHHHHHHHHTDIDTDTDTDNDNDNEIEIPRKMQPRIEPFHPDIVSKGIEYLAIESDNDESLNQTTMHQHHQKSNVLQMAATFNDLDEENFVSHVHDSGPDATFANFRHFFKLSPDQLADQYVSHYIGLRQPQKHNLFSDYRLAYTPHNSRFKSKESPFKARLRPALSLYM